MKVLGSTVRLQFNRDFTFDHAAACVDYYAQLGVSHYYASPIYSARAGSGHGYDVVDFGTVNPELGGEAGLRAMVARLRERGMGLVVDIVPNHMAVGEADNAWWLDVLRWGRESHYAQYFDIDWSPPDDALQGKLLAPFLGKPLDQVLADGDLKLAFDPVYGFHVDYGPHRFPIAPPDGVADLDAEDPVATLRRYNDDGATGQARLATLLAQQHYELADWHEAARRINWRRFFDVTSLAAIRADRDEVFEATHALPLRLYQEGLIDGFRIDHIDGLADPAGYLVRLRARLDELHAVRPQEFALATPWLVVEKILSPGERLRSDWQVDGATGYRFMDAVSGLLHDPAGEAPLTALWRDFTGERDDAAQLAYQARLELAESSFAADVDSLSALVADYAAAGVPDLSIDGATLREALLEFLAQFPIYRSYVDTEEAGRRDRAILRQTLADAAAQWAPRDAAPMRVIERWIETAFNELPTDADDAAIRAHRALQRMQKLLPALDAKSVEDTVFYRYGRLLSRNEVGSWPGQFAVTPDAFHALNQERLQRLPRSLLATATHDQKRGEDARLRIAVLSELPALWTTTVQRLRAAAPMSTTDAPTAADELMLYQTLVGAWPADLLADDAAGIAALGERVAAWQLKAQREAKRRTSWNQPDEAYEQASRAFLDSLLTDRTRLTMLMESVQRIAPYAALGSLGQTLLRLTVPGVPDLYQGTEFWDLSLVDPDNRRQVDHGERLKALTAAVPAAALLADWRDGRVKQALIGAALALRQEWPALFERGSYEPLTVQGPQADSALAFMRRGENGEFMVVIVTRLAVRADDAMTQPLVTPDHWQGTSVLLPQGAPRRLANALGGPAIVAAEGRVLLTDALATLPVALLRS